MTKHATTTPPDFTEHPYYAHVRNCEHCSGPHGHCAEGLKLKNADVVTDFTEQCNKCGCEYVQVGKVFMVNLDCDCDCHKNSATDLHEQARQLCEKMRLSYAKNQQLVDAIASFAAEAATQGQVAIVREINNCEKCDLCEDHLP